MRRVLLLLVLACAACAAPADLAYKPAPRPAAVPFPRIASVSVVDERDVGPSYVGAVMGWDGKPLKPLISPVPVADAVRDAFRQALVERGEMAATGRPVFDAPYDMEVRLLQLNAEQNAERQGEADVAVRLRDRRTGREVYAARVYTESRGENFLALNGHIFGSPSALVAVANAVLNRAIDQTVDKPGFRLALR